MKDRHTSTWRGLSHGVLSPPRLPEAPDASPWLVDDYLDTYVSWRAECGAVRRAYERLHNVKAADRQLAFATYEAALDREERAAHMLRERFLRLIT